MPIGDGIGQLLAVGFVLEESFQFEIMKSQGEDMAASFSFDMGLEEAMVTQRAVRRVKPDPVDDALLRRLIELAMKAPSQQDGQLWEFLVIRDPEVKAKLAAVNRVEWREESHLPKR